MRSSKKIFALFFLAVILLTACGRDKGYETAARQPSKESTGKKEESSRNLYLIDEMDMAGESITLESLNSSDKIVKYKYSLKTRFLNKYGENSSWNNFTPGRVVTIKNESNGSGLDEVRISDKAWEKDVKNFTIDGLNGIFTIGNTNYRIDNKIKVFSDGSISDINSIGDNDELRVVGIDKDLVSINITTGHGILELQNTDVFVDSMISVGSRIFTRITGNGMQIEVPEGTYTVTAANDGYGGSEDVTIKRGETTVLDLNELKGDGPKYSQITFHVAVDNASIYLDGNKITEDTSSSGQNGDTSVTVSVKYGRHALKVEASGYNTWERTLIVNSPTADIRLDLSDESSDSTDTNSSNSSGSSNPGTSSGSGNSGSSSNNSSSNSSGAGNGTSTNTGNSSSGSNSGSGGSKSLYNGTNYGASDSTTTENTRNAAASDYLQTMRDMIKSITGGD